MSTTVVISNPRPGHRPLRVVIQNFGSKQPDATLPRQEEDVLEPGDAISHCLYAGKRLVIEEVPE